MNKLIVILLLCCLSTIFTFECFAHTLDNVDGMELYESDTEETEKELEDLKTTYLASFKNSHFSDSELSAERSQIDKFRSRKARYSVINTPPPEFI